MGYMHIDNLYKNQDILMFQECYALEKVHGTSAHIAWTAEGGIRFHVGGIKHDAFVALFDADDLAHRLQNVGADPITVYGEAYGGKVMKMADTYGDELRFIAFEVKIGNCWLAVPAAEAIVLELGLNFVSYAHIYTSMENINKERDLASREAYWATGQTDKPREGVVLRPLVELRKNNGERIICKHKSEAFAERVHTPRVRKDAPEVIAEANAIADEWVTPMRLAHVLDNLGIPSDVTQTGDVIKAMVEDVLREASGEIVDSKPARRAIGKRAAALYKERIQQEALVGA